MSVADMYDRVSFRYNELVDDSHYIGPNWLENKIYPFDFEPIVCVDFGCANGILGQVLKKYYPETLLYGLDVSPEMIKFARTASIYNKLFIHDLNQPFKKLISKPADLVVALGFIEFLDDPNIFLADVGKILSNSGRCLMSFQLHEPNDPLLPRQTHSGEVIHHAYTVEEVTNLFESNFLTVLSMESVVGYTSGVGYACKYLMVEAGKSA